MCQIDDLIDIPLDQPAVDRFHQYLHGYFDCTRSSKKGCTDRYDILCLMNEVWSKVLIQREFSKNKIDEKRMEADGCSLDIDDLYDDNIEYSPYKLCHESVEWLTPCCAPRKHVVWRDKEGKVLFDRIIPCAKMYDVALWHLLCRYLFHVILPQIRIDLHSIGLRRQ